MTMRPVKHRGGDQPWLLYALSGAVEAVEAVAALGNSTCSSGHEKCLERINSCLGRL